MSKTAWGMVVSGAFAILVWLAPPVPDEWRWPLTTLAGIVFVFSIFGWIMAHLSVIKRLRSTRNALHPMVLLAIFILSGLLGIGLWLLTPKELPQSNVTGEISKPDYSPYRLSQMSKLELKAAAQEFAARLRVMGGEWDAVYNNDVETMKRKVSNAKSEEEKDLYRRERQAALQGLDRTFLDKFTKEYLTDARSLEGELRARLLSITIRGPAAIPFGQQLTPTLPYPPALMAGLFAGGNPLKAGAEYFDELAKLL